MAVVVIREATLTGSGDLGGRTVVTLYGDLAIPPEDPTRAATTDGSVDIPGIGSVVWSSWSLNTGTTPGAYTYDVGFEVEVTGPDASTASDTAGDTYTVTTTKVIAEEDGTGTWEMSAVCQLCIEITKPTPPSGTGAGTYLPDPPHGTTHRIFWRKKSGGAWSVTATIGAATATVSGTFGSAAELPYPDSYSLMAHATAESVASAGGESATATTSGSWRGGTIGADRTASGTHGSASATASGGAEATATATDDPVEDSAEAYATMDVAVPLDYTIDGQLRAMEAAYPDTMTLVYQRAGTTADVSATGSYGDSRTYRSESSEVWVKDGPTTEDSDSYSHPSNFGAISLSVKSSSATSLSEPTTDLYLLLKDRAMNALAIDVPTTTADLTGTDSALGGTPWGVQRDWTGTALGWQPLMGWPYLEVVVAETGGAGSGAAVTVKIGGKEWTKDRDGVALTAPGSGSSATWVLDLCSPTNQSATTDATDTTYPYDEDWSDFGGDEDDRYRTGEGPYTGLHRATTLRVEVGTSRTFTLTSVKGLRDGAAAVACTNLPAHNAWTQQRPDTIVSEADTTTEHLVRQSFMVDMEGRLLAAEWSDTEWDRTTGGVSGVVTHTLYERSIEWLYDRVTAAALCPGWTTTISAPVVGTGLAAYYNREREMHGIEGGGYRWEAPSVSYPAGRWVSGIDREMVSSGGSAQTLVWQGGFTILTACPGNVGDVYQHADSDTDGVLTLKAAKILRNQGVGMSLDLDGLRQASATLTLTQASTARGTGTSDADGYAQTGSSYGRGDGGDVQLDFDGGDAGTYPGRARKRLHFRGRVSEQGGGCVALALSPSMRLCRAFVDGGTLWLGFSSYPVAQGWTDTDTGLTTTCAWIGYSHADQAGKLIVAYESAGAVNRKTTSDEGATYSVATTVFAAGTHPAFCVSPTGVEHHFAYSAGTIKTKALDSQGNVLIAETTAVASGVDDDSIAAEWRDGYIVLLYVSGGAVTTKRSSDGVTFS